jgi:hypothetical protein
MVRKNDNEKIILIIKLIGIIFFVPRGTFLLYIKKKNGRVGVYSFANFDLPPLTWFPFHVSVYEWFIIRLHYL